MTWAILIGVAVGFAVNIPGLISTYRNWREVQELRRKKEILNAMRVAVTEVMAEAVSKEQKQ